VTTFHAELYQIFLSKPTRSIEAEGIRSEVDQSIIVYTCCREKEFGFLLHSKMADNPQPQPMTRLALETILYIISKVDDREILSTLCLTTKSLSSEAFKHLYSSIDGKDDGRVQIKFIGTLLRNPSLALFVRSYGIGTISPNRYNHAEQAVRQEENLEELEQAAKFSISKKYEYIWKILPKALSLMSNLKHLSFIELAERPCAPHLLSGWKRYGYTFKLKTLKWMCGEEKIEDVVNFLKGQEDLEDLSIRLSAESSAGSANGLVSQPLAQSSEYGQRLVRISGTLRTLLHFLPNRPSVTRVQWLSYWDEVDDVITPLSAEWGRITHLSTRGSHRHHKLVRGVAKGLFDSLLALEVQALDDVCLQLLDSHTERADEATRKSSKRSVPFPSSKS